MSCPWSRLQSWRKSSAALSLLESTAAQGQRPEFKGEHVSHRGVRLRGKAHGWTCELREFCLFVHKTSEVSSHVSAQAAPRFTCPGTSRKRGSKAQRHASRPRTPRQVLSNQVW